MRTNDRGRHGAAPRLTSDRGLCNSLRVTNRSKRPRGSGLGTFGGVFTPSVLTILGIILFRRLGYVVGSAGLTRALLMLGLATLISVLTSVSLSAIATNRKVKGGGDYYLISRSLGVEYGGALGLILFVAQAVSVAFYCIGFGEAYVSLAGGTASTVQLAAALAAFVLFGLAYAGADLATRFQFGIMVILIAALTSFFLGAETHVDRAILDRAWSVTDTPTGFWMVFAIFFPAVTGFTQGVSMSGDLEDPAQSLPRGTFLAVGVATVVYVVAIVALAASLPLSTLRDDYDALKRVAVVPGLIDAGVLAATLSSALASFLGAPRILQALASDQLFRWLTPFAVGSGPRANPRRGVVLTGAIALATIGVGNLNAIAAVVSMFFLVSYGLLNYATYIEAHGASPSFRPRFRFFHAYASLAGTALCGIVMLMIDVRASAVALAVLAGLYQYLRRTATPVRWVNSRRAYRFRLVKDGLRQLAELSGDSAAPGEWQPHILAFTASRERRERLLRVASWITGGSGMVTAVELVEGDGASPATRDEREAAETALREDLDAEQLDAFPLVVAGADLRVTATTLIQAWGIGPIRANTVLLNWLDSRSEPESTSLSLWYARLLGRAARVGQHVVVLDADPDEWRRLAHVPPESRRIDVWWFDDDSSRLGLLFAYLMTRTDEWDEASVRVVVPAAAGASSRTDTNLRRRLDELRIEADVQVVAEDDGMAYGQSADASMVFAPLHIEGMTMLDPRGQPLTERLDALPVVAMVATRGDVRLQVEDEDAELLASDTPDGTDAEPPTGGTPDDTDADDATPPIATDPKRRPRSPTGEPGRA